MATPRVSAGGGLAAIRYTLKKGDEAGGFWKLYKRLRRRSTCKTCALGMGGQKGGLVNEAGHFPEVCKKSLQAQVADMQPPVAETFFTLTPISLLERFTSAQCEALGRLSFPIIAEPGGAHFKRISWDEANRRMAEAFKQASPDETFFYSSGRASNEAAFLLQLLARAYGTNNVHNCSYYCHSASGVALGQIYGSGTASIVLDDLAHADLAVIIGANPASNHPRLLTQLMHLKRRGGRVIVINPLKELGLKRFRVPSDWRSLLFGTTIADLYIQPHIGGDVALLKGILKALLDTDRLDHAFIRHFTHGFEAVAADARAADWDTLAEQSGVRREDMQLAARLIGSAGSGIMMWAMGLTHHANGVDNIQALANLALARGWLGRPGCGLLPIRGHSNVQGVGSMGVSPKLKAAFAKRLEELYSIAVPERAGQDTYASMCAAAEGKIQAALLLGGNLWGSNPDLDWAGKALRKIPFQVTVSTKLNPGHIHGRGHTQLILPALARDEENQQTTQESMFNFVRLSDAYDAPELEEARSEVQILADLAENILPTGRFEWGQLRSHQALREAIAAVVPGYQAIGDIKDADSEFQIRGRTFHTPRFNTPDGKAQCYVTPLPKEANPDKLRLMTIRSEGQFNTVVYEEEDLYRGIERRDVIMLAAEDVERLKLLEGDAVEVVSEVGRLKVYVAIVDIRPGNAAMYYPEANVLVPRTIDQRTGTPAFKFVEVEVRAITATHRQAALKQLAG